MALRKAHGTLLVPLVLASMAMLCWAEAKNVRKFDIKKKKDATSPLTYVLAVIAVPISLFILFDDPPADPGACPRSGCV